MALPAPTPGLVICYSYHWHDEWTAEAIEGRKERPCAIVVATTDVALPPTGGQDGSTFHGVDTEVHEANRHSLFVFGDFGLIGP